MEYGKALRRAWQIMWRYRVLWIFGLLAALLGGGGDGANGGGLQYTANSRDWVRFPVLVPAVLIIIGLVVLLLIVVVIVLGYTGRGALIHGTNEVEESDSTTARTSWRAGWSRFPRLLGIDLVIIVPLIVIAAILIGIGVVPLLLSGAARGRAPVLGLLVGIPLLLLAAVLIFVIAVAVSFCTKFIYRVCVLEDRGVFDSISAGYSMARENLRTAGLMWLLMLAIKVGFSLLMVPLAGALIGVAAAPVAWLASMSSAPGLIVLAIPMVGVAILALAFVAGIFEVFDSSVWTLTYRALRATAGAEVELTA